MESTFRFSAPVISWLVILATGAVSLALTAPDLSTPLAMLGVLACLVIWMKVAIRTRKWQWWEFGVVSMTPVEGIIGISGAVLFAAGFFAIVPAMQHAT
jgi:hypothetical protein